MISDPLAGESPQGVLPLGGAADGWHGNQTSEGWDVGVPTHWGRAGNAGTGVDKVLYCLLPEHCHAIHCDTNNHGIVFGGGAESKNAPIQVMW